ncbi:MAG: O-antigen ligase family protein [Cyclobacteriaceae bacterium]|nr:O-antigen ligase family protein [Cyclobacteriaceae bacterium]
MRVNRVSQEKIWTSEFSFLFILSLSYLYCLPLLRTGVIAGVTASEVRLYDLVFIIMFGFVVSPQLSAVFRNWSSFSRAHKFLLYWIVLGLIGLFVTLLNNENRFLIGIIRYFRFFSFSMIFVLGFMFIKNKKQLLILFDAIIICIAIISVIGTLQGFRILPNLWPDYYAIYSDFEGGYLSTATLAPNHTHYSLIMAFGIIMIVTRFTISFRLSFLNIIYLISLLPMLYSMIASRGRSGWLVLGVYLLITLILSRNIKGFIFGLLLVGGVGLMLDSNIKAGDDTVEEILLYRSINAHKQLGRTVLDVVDEEEKNWIERVDDNRWYIYQRSIEHLLGNPQYLLIGAGFQNASTGIGKVALAAHNAYINVVAEHGLVGLFIYLAFLYYLYQLGVTAKRNANNEVSYIMAISWIGLFGGVVLANFFGEIIYPGRALFTFLGTFFILTVLFLHPAWQKEHSSNSSHRND